MVIVTVPAFANWIEVLFAQAAIPGSILGKWESKLPDTIYGCCTMSAEDLKLLLSVSGEGYCHDTPGRRRREHPSSSSLLRCAYRGNLWEPKTPPRRHQRCASHRWVRKRSRWGNTWEDCEEIQSHHGTFPNKLYWMWEPGKLCWSLWSGEWPRCGHLLQGMAQQLSSLHQLHLPCWPHEFLSCLARGWNHQRFEPDGLPAADDESALLAANTTDWLHGSGLLSRESSPITRLTKSLMILTLRDVVGKSDQPWKGLLKPAQGLRTMELSSRLPRHTNWTTTIWRFSIQRWERYPHAGCATFSG